MEELVSSVANLIHYKFPSSIRCCGRHVLTAGPVVPRGPPSRMVSSSASTAQPCTALWECI